MNSSSRRLPFQVDLAGITEIMGSSLYSRADTPIRELLQNAHDAIMRRRHRSINYRGRIDVRQHAQLNQLSISDDGIGLTLEEAESFLGTLGTGINRVLKREARNEGTAGEEQDLIGQFGVGLFSGFMLATRIQVESRHDETGESFCWRASLEDGVELGPGTKEEPGTTVTLDLKREYGFLAAQPSPLERAIREHADFLPIPIYLNDGQARINVIHAAWDDPSPDRESIELALQTYFDETPLEVIPIRLESPVEMAGALYVTPQRVPGFNTQPTVMVTVRRMVISRKIQGLLPNWATFLRGCLELRQASPTASREDLVRDERFDLVRDTLEELLYSHFENLVQNDPQRMESIINWHRYTFAGSAIENGRLRSLLKRTYRMPTSHGSRTIQEILEGAESSPQFEEEADRVIWYNRDRRQERWINTLFADVESPCIHTFRSFEETLLAQCAADEEAKGKTYSLRLTSPSAPGFVERILGLGDLTELDHPWEPFLSSLDAKVMIGSLRSEQPAIAFLNERQELARSFEELKRRGELPSGFQRLMESHFREDPVVENEVILNRNHPVIARALSQPPGTPLSSVVRMLAMNALTTAGAAISEEARMKQRNDLEWIAECLWGRD